MTPGVRVTARQLDEIVISRNMLLSVIPAKAGIQKLQAVSNYLDSGLRRSDGKIESIW